VTANGSAFKFNSVDLYSSITPIPFEISGFRNGGLVFRLSGTHLSAQVPNDVRSPARRVSERWQGEQREQRRGEQPADHDNRERPAIGANPLRSSPYTY
jgi:hypothetical protein